MHPERLLAKKCPPDGLVEAALLENHLQAVEVTAGAVLELSGRQQLSAMGLDEPAYRTRLDRIVTVAAALHDLGKANDHFQAMIRGRLPVRQGLRHEWVVWLLLQQSTWQQWSQAAFGTVDDWHLMLWCIAGHHPGHGRPCPPTPPEGSGSELTVLASHPDLRSAVTWIAGRFDLPDPPASPGDLTWSLVGTCSDNAVTAIRRLMREHRRRWRHMPARDRLLLACCKACLIGADVAGSAQYRAVQTVEGTCRWVRRALATVPSQGNLNGLVEDRLRGAPPRRFQVAVSSSTARVTLLLAGCGTGKTLAAYMWAARQGAGRRLYFCYPTTGTATEGFRNYLFDPDAASARHGAHLFHSRASVDLQLILDVGPDADEHEQRLRHEALEAWSTPIACCTVDTVLGLVQNQRRGLFAWPALAGSSFIFDEIHAYDDRLFAALLRFVATMRGLPMLLMTASLPRPRLEALQDILQQRGEHLATITGPADLEQLARYTFAGLSQWPEQVVEAELDEGGRVLWVCNTVGRAMATADRLADRHPLLYHSRFRYEDRVQRHAAVIGAFEQGSGEPVLAVCTQVAEVSLDLSATLMVSDLAPIPAMIQRLGRLNRRAQPGPDGSPDTPPRPFHVVEPLDRDGRLAPRPYVDHDLAAARRWLERLGGRALSQKMLAEAWEQVEVPAAVQPVASTWLDGGPCAPMEMLREPSPGITVILDGEDAQAVRTGRKPVSQVALPMPPHGEWASWPRLQGIPVAPRDLIDYDPQRGGRWRDN